VDDTRVLCVVGVLVSGCECWVFIAVLSNISGAGAKAFLYGSQVMGNVRSKNQQSATSYHCYQGENVLPFIVPSKIQRCVIRRKENRSTVPIYVYD
jgi:hypothetical protein